MKLLETLYQIYSGSNKEDAMRNFISRWIKKNVKGACVVSDNTGNLLVTKGKSDTYPCLVSHMDQVQKPYPTDYMVLNNGVTIMAIDPQTRRTCGLGADDKNGIWICLKALEKYDVMKCVFFVAEEVGMRGSRGVCLDWFDDCRWVIECDRRGHQDFINETNGVDVCTASFMDACHIKSHKYSPDIGTATDIGVLKKRGLNVCCANLSCGYYKAHTEEEYTVVPDLLKCQSLVCYIIENVTDVYKHVYKEPMPVRSYGLYYNKPLWKRLAEGSEGVLSLDELAENVVLDTYARCELIGGEWDDASIERFASLLHGRYKRRCLESTNDNFIKYVRNGIQKWNDEKI